MRFLSKHKLLGLFLSFVGGFTLAEVPKGLQFRADYYQRDLTSNTLKGKGNAWIKNGPYEIFADEIEVDFTANQAIARENVKMSEKDVTVSCSQASFNLKGPDAVFDRAVLTFAQTVITGDVIRRISPVEYEVLEGTFSNCNNSQVPAPDAAKCPMDWMFSGRRFRFTLGEYAHFYDVVASAKSIPFLYTPYMMIPIKTQRQTGFLMPSAPWSATLGSGFSLPFFWAISEWQDLLVRPTWYSSTGSHLGLDYRYAYSPGKQGYFNLSLITRRFGSADNPGPDNSAGPRFLGLFGEGAVNAWNLFRLDGSRIESRQMLNFVSNPYYTFDYLADVGARADLGNLRSQFSLIFPGDSWFFSAQAQYLQPLTVSIPNNNSGTNIDGGGAAQLPILTAAKATTPLFGQYISYELDTQLTNYSRSSATDLLTNAALPSNITPLTESIPYIRTGRRLQMEPRLVLNLPTPPGFQLQPLLRGGTLVYQFDAPSATVRHREYLDVEVPFAMQLSRTFNTSFLGIEKLSHIFQPRFIYASSLLQTGGNDHAFFYSDEARQISNPRFDILDQITPYEYMRFELINRFLRKKDSSMERFFWFQVSEQYNLKTSTTDPRFSNALGPIEVFSSLSLGRYTMQLTASFALQETRTLMGQPVTPVRESSLSTGITYSSGGKNVISLNGLYRKSANPALDAQMMNLSMYQELPTFFDIDGSVEYNFITHRIYGFRVGLHFQSKPRACWGFSIAYGQTSFGVPFTTLGFSLDMGKLGAI